MASQTRQSIRFRACQRCCGDAYLDMQDDPEWRCLQCARPVGALVTADLGAPSAVARAA